MPAEPASSAAASASASRIFLIGSCFLSLVCA
jgi:hypothetical protein